MDDQPQVIVVTGGNDGIGLAMVRALLDDVHRVAVLDLENHHLNALTWAHPDHLAIFRCDVGDAEAVRSSVSAIVELWQHIDVLVNNACIALFKPFEQRSEAENRKEFEVNYHGYLNAIAAVLPHMKAAGGGIIHNVSSGVGITGFPGISGYAATKGAIEAMTRTLALELAPYGIAVNLMHPPLTNTQSASPLGIPSQAMDDPTRVGRRLAKRIMSRKPVIASDLRTGVYLFAAYRWPRAVGRLFARLAAAGRAR